MVPILGDSSITIQLNLLNVALFAHGRMQRHGKSEQRTLQSSTGFHEISREVIAMGACAGEYRQVDIDSVAVC